MHGGRQGAAARAVAGAPCGPRAGWACLGPAQTRAGSTTAACRRARNAARQRGGARKRAINAGWGGSGAQQVDGDDEVGEEVGEVEAVRLVRHALCRRFVPRPQEVVDARNAQNRQPDQDVRQPQQELQRPCAHPTDPTRVRRLGGPLPAAGEQRRPPVSVFAMPDCTLLAACRIVPPRERQRSPVLVLLGSSVSGYQVQLYC